MAALLIMILAFAGYIIMYQLYGKFIGNKIFALSAAAKAPSVELEDGTDYVPTKKEVIFGHHFTSIAGTGPIVGPAIAIIWGWVPAIIWIFVGISSDGIVVLLVSKYLNWKKRHSVIFSPSGVIHRLPGNTLERGDC